MILWSKKTEFQHHGGLVTDIRNTSINLTLCRFVTVFGLFLGGRYFEMEYIWIICKGNGRNGCLFIVFLWLFLPFIVLLENEMVLLFD